MERKEMMRIALTYPDAVEWVEAMIDEAVKRERDACAAIANSFHNQMTVYFSDKAGLHNQTAIDIANTIKTRVSVGQEIPILPRVGHWIKEDKSTHKIYICEENDPLREGYVSKVSADNSATIDFPPDNAHANLADLAASMRASVLAGEMPSQETINDAVQVIRAQQETT